MAVFSFQFSVFGQRLSVFSRQFAVFASTIRFSTFGFLFPKTEN